MKPARLAVLAWLFTLLIGGCHGFAAYDQRDGAAIADAIRAAGATSIQDVTYKPGDYLDPATIDVILKPGVSKADAAGLVCSVVKPAIAAARPPDSLGVVLWDPTATSVVATEQDCP